MPAEQKAALQQALDGVIGAVQSGNPRFSGPIYSKLCAVYAIAMVASPDNCKALLESMLAQAAASGNAAQLAFLLTFARCVCEETEEAEIPFAAKDSMEMHLVNLSESVVQLIGKVVLTRDNASVVSLHGEAFACLKVWIKKAGVSLASLFTQDPAMLYTLIEALCSKSGHLPICAEILGKLITVASYPTSADLDRAIEATAHGLLKTRAACESAIEAEEDEVCHAITDVVSTFCETYADWMLEGPTQDALALAEMMLFLGSQPRRQIASLTLEFWLVVQEEPVASRHSFFQREAFVRLLDVLLKQCTYPGDLAAIDELELDDITDFRTGFQGVSDGFLAIFGLLKDQYVNHVLTILKSPASNWQTAEVALFAMSSVADDAKKHLLKKTAANNGAALEPLVMDIFQCILTARDAHPMVITAASKLLGQFGAWLHEKSKEAQSFDTVGTVAQYLTAALAVDRSCSVASKSLMQVATSCSSCFAEMPPVFLLGSVQHFNDPHMSIDDRLLIVEGQVRVAATSVHCSAILQAVLTDSLTKLDHVLGSSSAGGDELVPIMVCNELKVLSKAIRFLDAPADVAGGKAVTSWAVELVWPHLEPIIARLDGNEAVMNELFQLYSWCLQSLRQDMAGQLGFLANLIVHVFERFRFVSALECASVAIDVFGKAASNDEQIVDSFRGLMGVLSQTAFQFFTTHSLSDSPDVLRSFYELAYRFLLFCPAAVLTSQEFPMLLELSLACLGNQDRASTNAVLVFLTYLLNESEAKLQAFRGVIDECVLGVGQPEKWTDNLLLALAVKSPSVLFDSVGKLFFALMSAYGNHEQLRSALHHAMSTRHEALGMAELAPEDRERVLTSWLTLASTPSRMSERKFRGLSSDFAKVCRKEMTADAFHAFEVEG